MHPKMSLADPPLSYIENACTKTQQVFMIFSTTMQKKHAKELISFLHTYPIQDRW